MQTYGVNVAVFQNEKVLLTLRSDLPVWCLPGGAIEDGETLVEAAIRECQEETGAEVEILGIVGVYSRPNWRDGGNYEVVFKGKQVGGELFPYDGEAIDISYFNLTELPKSLIWWHHERIYDAAYGHEVVARKQDVRWPLEGVSNEETKQLLLNGKLSTQQLVEYFSTKPADSDSYLELGEIKHTHDQEQG